MIFIKKYIFLLFICIYYFSFSITNEIYRNSYDLFSDSSMFLVEVSGHTKGQACLFLPEDNLFLAADVCWGTDFLPLTEKMKWLPRKIQNNFEEYKKGTKLLEKLIEDKISVIVSHDKKEKIIDILSN